MGFYSMQQKNRQRYRPNPPGDRGIRACIQLRIRSFHIAAETPFHRMESDIDDDLTFT